MRVAGFDLALASSQQLVERRSQSLDMRSWVGRQPADDRGSVPAPADGGLFERLRQARRQPPAPVQSRAQEPSPALDAKGGDRNAQILIILEKVFGMKGLKLASLDLSASQAQAERTGADLQASTQAAQAQGGEREAGWGFSLDYREEYERYEVSTLKASGTVRTADGRELAFALDYRLERYEYRSSSLSLRAGDAVRSSDPLVLDLGGGIAFQAGRTGIDLDGDGKAEQVARLAPGSAWLARDLNRDGRIDRGSELFGPTSGKGFAELAALDADRNGVVDAQDPAFHDLLLWDGGGSLRPLAAAGVGALATASAALPFSYRDGSGREQAVSRQGGVWLDESGRPRALQQVDLVAS